MSQISFKLEKRQDEKTGTLVDTLVKVTDGKEEVWCTVQDLDRLFDACVSRWDSNWDLEKVITAVQEAEFD